MMQIYNRYMLHPAGNTYTKIAKMTGGESGIFCDYYILSDAGAYDMLKEQKVLRIWM